LLQFLQKKSRVPSDSIKIFETSWSQSSKEISEVRHNVFVVEQSVPSEIEMDGKDSDCIHFLALEKSKPIGAARLQKYGKIERVSVLREYRSKGIGTAIMKRVIESAMDLNVEKIYLHSQMDSKIFYQRLGFIELGQIFYEANIIHFLALEKSKPIGAARLQKYGKIERVSVLREYRSKGIGTAIMKRVIESAMDLNVEKIYLHSQMDSKIFYQQLGFIELGQIFYEANIPHIEMILK